MKMFDDSIEWPRQITSSPRVDLLRECGFEGVNRGAAVSRHDSRRRSLVNLTA